MGFAFPIYYNLILLAVAGSLGYYLMVSDVHRYAVTSSLLVQGVLLPFAVRMYRSRLPIDVVTWRAGADDMGAFYLVASMFAGLDVFRSVFFTTGSWMHMWVSVLTRWSAMLLALIIIMEACLLGCTTKTQIVAVLLPVLILITSAPHTR